MASLLSTLKFAIEICTGVYAVSFVITLIFVSLIFYTIFKENKKDREEEKERDERFQQQWDKMSREHNDFIDKLNGNMHV